MKNKHHKSKAIWILLVLIATFGLIFMMLYRTNLIFVKYAEHGVVTGKVEQEQNFKYDILLYGKHYQFQTKDKSLNIDYGVINFKYRKDTIVQFLGYIEPLQEKIMSIAPSSIELEYSGIINTAKNFNVYKMLDNGVSTESPDEIYVGARNIKSYKDKNGNIKTAIIMGNTPLDIMRVGIKDQGFDSLGHTSIEFISEGGINIESVKENKKIQIKPNCKAVLTPSQNGILLSFEGVNTEFKSRVYASPSDSKSYIKFLSFKRGYGSPAYRGYFEITCDGEKLHVVNEVDLEDYLCQVVPSEMPASFGLEALKAQAVAARTYAISDMISKRYASEGFHVDDSTMSQVYNNSPENELATRAVHETEGLVMKYDGALIDAKYYSTSHGYGANPDEIWSSNGIFPGNKSVYLTAKSYLLDGSEYDLSSEDEAYRFFKDWDLKSYDSNSPYFRWKVTFTKQELQNTIEKNLPIVYEDESNYILTLADGKYISEKIPDNCLGNLKDLKVTRRGGGGNIMELVIEGSKGTYKIIKELNVRYVLRPRKSDTKGDRDIAIERIKSKDLINPSLLPSAFMVFDITRNPNQEIEYVTFYGGGYGHGVGMSQYGAGYLASNGHSFKDILNTYYTGIDIEKIY